MGRRITRIALMMLIAAAFLVPLLVEACGPDFSPPIFTYNNFPGVPLQAYARGKLDLLEPGFYHIYLFAAYRNLSGKPLGKVEIGAMRTVLAESGYWNTPEEEQSAAPSVQPVNWMQRWKEDHEKVLGSSVQRDIAYDYDPIGISRQERKDGQYIAYYNCLSGAFQSAVGILNRRIAQFGPESPYVKQWLAAQDQVFANCPGSYTYPPRPAVVAIPAPAPASAPAVIREDRAYQIAAAHFYAEDFEQARTEFAAIAKDHSSPYRKIAPYLVARALVREGTLTPGMGTVNAKALGRAERQLQSILADRNLSEIHHAARGLLEFVRIRLYPREREKELVAAIGGDKPNPDFRQNLIDYLWLLDRFETAGGLHVAPAPAAAQHPAGAEISLEASARPGHADMTDWILTFQKSGPEAYRHSLARWRRTHLVAWLVAAISKVHPSDAAAGHLEAAALKVAPESPAYVTVAFHRLRLLAESGHAAQARAGLDRFLSNPALGLTPSTRNQFLALRSTVSTSLADWLHFAARVPVGYGDITTVQGQQGNPQAFFDTDASVVLTEKLPLRLLVQAARSATLPALLRKQIAIAAWTRAILLHNTPIAREMTPVLAALAPELKSQLVAYSSAKYSAARRFAAAFLILHFPAMRPFIEVGEFRVNYRGTVKLSHIDPFRDNWWCLLGPPPKNAQWQLNYYTMYTKLTPPLRQIYPDGKVPSPAFLNGSERAFAAKEWSALQSIPAAPTWLGRETLAWAKAHPNDRRVPEALHLVVRSTRYGCLDTDSGTYSRRAFTLLHRRYPRSPWTRKTPYWFKQ